MPFKLFGILGYPLSHTLSPAMQEAAFVAAGLKAFYVDCEVHPRNFQKIVKRLHLLPLDGYNVTVPYKEAVNRALRSLTPEAKAIGAVNTVFRKGGRWIGANTDSHGFICSLKTEAGFKIKEKSALIFGAGGSARAVAFGLASEGARSITIANRHVNRAQVLVRDFKRKFKHVHWKSTRLDGPALRKNLNEADLVVNCTSVGLKRGDVPVIPSRDLPDAKSGKRQCYADLIYKPAETRFLKQAKSKGHQTLNGLGMLLHQGAKAFQYWTGKKAPVSLMRKALLKALDHQ